MEAISVTDNAIEQPAVAAASVAVAAETTTTTTAMMSVHTNLLLYRFCPIGSYTIDFDLHNTQMAHISGSDCCFCCCSTDASVPMNLTTTTLQVQRQYLWNWWRLLRDAGLAFVAAFLFHLVPAIIWGAEQSLGSPSNHQLMGAVWFIGWPIWFFIFQCFLRPWGIRIESSSSSNGIGAVAAAAASTTAVFVPFASWKHATDIVIWWEKYNNRNQQEKEITQSEQQQVSSSQLPTNIYVEALPEKPKLICGIYFVVGWIFFLFLIVNMFVTGYLVAECNSQGCCKDDETTLDCCVETGYPEC